MKKEKVSLYRYQIHPINHIFVNELVVKETKNEIFESLLFQIKEKHSNYIYNYLWNEQDKNIICLSFQKKVCIDIEKKDMTHDKIDSYPSSYVFIDNDPNIQILLIVHNSKINADDEKIATDFIKLLNSISLDILINIEPIKDKKEIWNIINENKGQITGVKFYFNAPNLPSVTNKLSESLKQSTVDMNATTGMMQLKSEKEDGIKLDQNNENIASMIDYTALGGGNISLKIKHMRTEKNLKKSNVKIEVDGLEIKNGNTEEIVKIIKEITSGTYYE